MAFQPVNTNLGAVREKALTDRAVNVLAREVNETANSSDGVQLSGPPAAEKEKKARRSSSSSSPSLSPRRAALQEATAVEPAPPSEVPSLEQARAEFSEALQGAAKSSPEASEFLKELVNNIASREGLTPEQKEKVLAQGVMVYAYDSISKIDRFITESGEVTPEKEAELKGRAEPLALAALRADSLMKAMAREEKPPTSDPLNFEGAAPGAGLGSEPPLATPGEPPPPEDPAKAERDQIQQIMNQMWEDRKKFLADIYTIIQDTNKYIFETWQSIVASQQAAIQKGIDTFNAYLNTW